LSIAKALADRCKAAGAESFIDNRAVLFTDCIPEAFATRTGSIAEVPTGHIPVVTTTCLHVACPLV
jgi:hypothetical protein